MNNWITIKLRYFLEWILRHSIQDMKFKTKPHLSFISNTTLVIDILDKTNNSWVWAFGKLKPDENKKMVEIQWHNIFGDWYACIYRTDTKRWA